MPEQYDWEWLKQHPRDSSQDLPEQDSQIHHLRRWIEPDPDNPESADAPQQSEQRARRRSWLEKLGWFRHRSQSRSGSPQVSSAAAESQPHPTPPQPTQKNRPFKKNDYQEQLKQDFSQLFEGLELQERQKHYLRSRWLDQVLWMEGRANKARDLHYKLRLMTIIGGVVIPALVSLNFGSSENSQFKQGISISAFVLSQIVAISGATEQFFNYGERWRHYRRSVESLKTQGWQFLELTGPYQAYNRHEQAFNVFAGQVESVLQRDVEVYATQVTQARKEEEQRPDRALLESKPPEFMPMPGNRTISPNVADTPKHPIH